MSTLNSKSGLNRLFPFAKKKPNIPSKILDKSNTKTSKQKLAEKKNCLIIKTSEQIQCETLTENNDKLKTIQEKAISNESPKKVLIDTCKAILSQNSESDIKSISRKLSNASEISMEGIKKSKETYQRWNIPLSNKFKGKDVDKTILTMQDFIYYNPDSNPILKEMKTELKEEDDPDNDLLPIKTDQKSSVSKNCITPCIKVGADGKIIIDQETLTLNETGFEEKREELAKSKVIEESAFRSFSYKRKQQPSKKWTKDETLKFYKCLMNLGTDFSMIEQYFPGRTRAQIKRKYKTEEKHNPQLINGAFTNTTHYDGFLIENMFQEDDEDFKETEKDKINKVDETVHISVPPKTSRRLHKNVIRSDCKNRISRCAYLMEEEIVLKKKRKPKGKVPTADSLKAGISVLKSLKDKTEKYKSSTTVTKSKIKASPKVDEQNDPLPKVRRLQDFHEEYEENTQLEQDSNSE